MILITWYCLIFNESEPQKHCAHPAIPEVLYLVWDLLIEPYRDRKEFSDRDIVEAFYNRHRREKDMDFLHIVGNREEIFRKKVRKMIL
ncbi:hypothetical protein [Dapis sp. BLCC M229]|uniref:hypothetical protein n=1 Tax=Dapis sp. BLCC M229 TaxID=3400188 RepID=UPI003CFAE518